MEKTEVKVLTFLYSSYLSHPSKLVDVSSIVTEEGADLSSVYKHLLDKGVIRNASLQNERLLAQITMAGIREIDSKYATDGVAEIIKRLVTTTGKRSIMEVLKYEPQDFQKAFDIVKYAEEKGILENSLYLPTDIFVKLSSYGKEVYEKHKVKLS